MTKFKKLVQETLKEHLSKEDLRLLPTGFQQVGDKAILSLNPKLLEYKFELSKEILNLFKNITGVYLKVGGISGDRLDL